MDAHDAIAARTSTRAFADRPVPRAVLERLIAAAVRAPNHKLTEPWRFAVLTGRSAARFAELRRAHRATQVPRSRLPRGGEGDRQDLPRGARHARLRRRELARSPRTRCGAKRTTPR